MKSEHCWHGIGRNVGEDREEICCFCGVHYEPTNRIPFPGHGMYSPDRMRPDKPVDECLGRIAHNQAPVSENKEP